MKPLLLLSFCFALDSSAQTIYELPFASQDNEIELAIENTGSLTLDNVKVSVQSRPDWISFRSNEAIIDQLEGSAEKSVSFTFSVDKTASVGKEHVLSFVIHGPASQTWTKTITVSVSAPEKFELFQNYPNPFNPTTTISYQLNAPGRVRLVIYNLLGQEVATLVDAEREAGFHRELWHASSLSSGLYIYRITATDKFGDKIVENKTMSLVK
ncbi:MAG: hypothetical protein HBSIN02_24790 [Bacteroidia bacterium]|nr:MAG: hypothetical protein HBSIN02_24790 [Bacteroidia bacterium]